MALDADIPVRIRNIAKTGARRLRVMAGPGTGKSWALKERAIRLIEEGQDPSRIWAVTFTRNAAKELSDDLADPEIPGGELIRVSTLHSYCFGLLSEHEAHTGRTPRLVMATLSSKRLKFEYATLVRDLINENPEFGDEDGCSERINKFVAGWAEMESDMLDDPVNQSLEKRLNSWLGFHKAMLMSELVPESLRLLRSGRASDVLAAFDHVIVDEYQDLNKAEQEIINIVSASGSLAIVGDANQSIYSFRHAHPNGIKDFQVRHADTRDASLVECLRNPVRVVEMANNLIARNHPPGTQPGLQPKPDKPNGEVHIVRWNTIDEEAEGIAKYVKHLTDNRVCKPEDILIMAPWKILGRNIHDAVSGQGVPVYNFDQDVLAEDAAQRAFALLTLLGNGQDRVMLRWWLGHDSPRRLSGPYQKLREYCEVNGRSPRSVLEDMARGRIDLPDASPLLVPFRNLVEETDRLSKLGLRDLVDGLLPEDRKDCAALRKIAERVLAACKDIREMYERVLEDIIQPEYPSNNSVRVMTMHKTKGLSSKVVIVAGCCDGLIPFKNNKLADDKRSAAMREQRRLFYVAITRCKKVLVLSYFDTINASERFGMRIPFRGQDQSKQRYHTPPSPFMDELGSAIPSVIDGAAWQAAEYMEQSHKDQI